MNIAELQAHYPDYDLRRDVYIVEYTDRGGDPNFDIGQGIRHKSPGYVYLLEAHPQVYKIGRTSNLKSRLHQFRITLPFEANLLHHIETDDMVFGEIMFHLCFVEKRLKGEWFNLTPDEVYRVCRISSMNWYTPSELTEYIDSWQYKDE